MEKDNSILATSLQKGPPKACLFVANIPVGVREEQLIELFSQYGEVGKVTIPKNHLNVAFIQYLKVEDSEKALLANIVIEGKKLRLEKSKSNSTLFIARMSYSITSNQLKEICERFGPVEKATIITNYSTKTSKGCGFVKFLYREDALACLIHAQQNPSFGESNQKWVVEWALSTEDQMNIQTIFIGGLNKQITEDLLKEKFQQYGHIEKISLINNRDEGPAYAFIQYQDSNEAANAIKSEDGIEWYGDTIRVQYSESLEMKTRKRNIVLQSMAPYLVQLPSSFSPVYRGRSSSDFMMVGSQPKGIPNTKGAPRIKKGESSPYMMSSQGMYPVYFTLPSMPFFPTQATHKNDVFLKENNDIPPSAVKHEVAVE